MMGSTATTLDPRREEARPPGSWVAQLLPPLLLVAAVFAAFAPALSAGFVAWDDDKNFELNHAWRGLGPDQIAWMFTTFHMGHYQPLSWITLGADFEVWGMRAPGFHLTNVVLHALTAVAFWFVARRLVVIAHGRDVPLAAFAAALVFALHPLRVESVAWVTERRDVLSGVFFVSAVGAWLRYAMERRTSMYVLALALMLLSLLAKAAAIVMPALLIVLDVWPLKRSHKGWSRLLLEKVPFFGASVVFGTVAILAQASQATTLVGLEGHGPLQRAAQAAYGLVFYVWRTLVPRNLIPIHEIPAPFDVFSARFMMPIALVLAAAVVLVALRKRAPALLVAALAYAIILSPTSGIAQSGPQLVADRYSYLACMPFAILAGCAVAWVLAQRPTMRPGVAVTIVAVACGLGWLTHQQSRHWHDSEALWRHTVTINPRSHHGLMNLGSVIMRRGAERPDKVQRERDYAEAEALFDRGIAVRPDPQMYVNKALIALFRAQDDPGSQPALVERAIDLVETGIELGKQTGHVKPEWRLTLASTLLTAGRCAEAVAILEELEPWMPATSAVHRTLSLSYDCVGRKADALAQLRMALRLEPETAILWLRAGVLAAQLGDADAARTAYRNVLDLRAAQIGPRVADDPQWKQARQALDELQ